jgi:hypothetical protein
MLIASTTSIVASAQSPLASGAASRRMALSPSSMPSTVIRLANPNTANVSNFRCP